MDPLQQMTFENIVAKGEIAHHEQFLILPLCFQIYAIILFSTLKICNIFPLTLQSRRLLQR